MMDITLEKPLPIVLKDVADVFRKYYKIPEDNIVKQRGTMYNIYMDSVGTGCYVSIKIPPIDSSEGIHLNVRHNDGSGNDTFVYAKKQTDKTSSYKTGVIKRTTNWADQVIEHTNIGLSMCHTKYGKAKPSSPKAKTVKTPLPAPTKAPSKASVTAPKPLVMNMESVVLGGLVGYKCVKGATGTGVCKNIRAKVVGDTSKTAYWFNITKDNVKNFNAVSEGNTYEVPNLNCKAATSGSTGKGYQSCYIPKSTVVTFKAK